MPKKSTFNRHFQNFLKVVGIVLMWRGIWYLLDQLDMAAFGGSHIITAIVGIITGISLIYLLNFELEDVI